LGGAGVLFLYSAYKAKSPQAVLMAHLNGGSGSGIAPASAITVQKTNVATQADYSIVPDLSGTKNVYQNGVMVGSVPPAYNTNSGLYIPTITGGVINA
jgi:hypothetical protein